MAMNFDAVLRLAAKVVGLEDITKLEKGLSKVEKGAGEVKSAFGAVAGSAMWQAAAAGAAVFAAGVGYAVKAAIDFESSMADVRKVVAGLESPEAFRQMQLEILELSNTMPIAAAGFAEIYAAAGQSGIAKEGLREFATAVAQVSLAFDMTAQQAGTAMAQMRAALDLTTPQLVLLADAINTLADNSRGALTAGNLVEFMTRAAAMGKLAGLSGQQTAAFGAAMIQTGVQAEVAATSFNNMIRALTKGPSMTDRQVGALRRLGYSMADAASEERRLTDAVQMESDKRIDQYREESNQLLKEINRRYRDEQQNLQDQVEDESRDREKALRKRTDAQIRAINEDKTLTEEAKRQRLESIQDALDKELTMQRRADRDWQRAIQDKLDDQQEQERNAVTGRLKAFENSEKKFVETAKVEAKKTGEELANASKQGFADRMQKDAIGTITEVLGKINGLAKSQQISVLSDLFGDEARGLAPMISNLSELQRLLGLVGNAADYSGSVAKEYGVRIATAAAQLQLFWNKLHNLAILIGTTVLPYMSQMVGGLMPLLDAVGAFAKAHPGITAAAVAIGSVTAAVILLLPALAALIVSIGIIKGAMAGLALGSIAATIAGWAGAIVPAFLAVKAAGLGIVAAIGGIGATIAGWAGVIGPAIAALKALVATAAAVIAGFITWPVIIGVALVAAAVAIWAFRDQIGKFFQWLGGIAAEGWRRYREFATNTFKWLIEQIQAMPGRLANGARNIGLAIGNGIANAVRSILTAMFNWIGSKINGAVDAINFLIRAANKVPGISIPVITRIPTFAQGGTVDSPTLAMVGEGGEREYIVPESKMTAASSRFLGGARGASVIPSSSSSGTANGISPIQIAITTGPVMQDQSGQRWMTIEDGERLARQTAEQVQRQLRTPGGRYAAGVR
jgi:TP901 family phage tail tape measure protein